MNPFESIAGRKISRSTGATCNWAWADATKPVTAAAMTAAWIRPRRGRAIMNTSGRTGARTSGSTELTPKTATDIYISVEIRIKALSCVDSWLFWRRTFARRAPTAASGSRGSPLKRARRGSIWAVDAIWRSWPARRWSLRRSASVWSSRPSALPLAERVLPAGRRLPRLAAPARDEREAAISLAARASRPPARSARGSPSSTSVPWRDRRSGDVRAGVCPPRRGVPTIPAGSCWRTRSANAARGRPRFWMPASGRWNACSAPPTAPDSGWPLKWASRPGSRSAHGRPTCCVRLRRRARRRVGIPGRLSLLSTLELPVADDRLKSLAAAAAVVIENDAVGVEAGYLPGLGERPGGSPPSPRRPRPPGSSPATPD